MPSYQNEFEYEFLFINLPVGAEDLTAACCFGSVINGCGKFVIKVDDELKTCLGHGQQVEAKPPQTGWT